MNQSLCIPENHLHHDELQKITTSLLSFIDADSIYVSPEDPIQERKSIISLLIKKGSNQTSEELYTMTEKLFKSYPQFAYRISETDWAEYSYRKGNPFFLLHCSKEELIYTIPNNSSIFNPTAAHAKHLLKKAKRRYAKDAEQTRNLSKDLALYIKNENHLQAAYILHQTIRQLYYTACWFLTGESIPSRSIAEQQQYIHPFSGLLGSLFDNNDKADLVLLEQLDGACKMVRNNQSITINKETIPAATAKAEWLQKEVQRLFENTIRSCEEKFTSSFDNPKTIKSNHTNNPDNKNAEALNALEELQELASLYFKKLKPDPNSEGIYTAKIKMIGYTDLMATISDLIKLSITAHNDNEENGNNNGDDDTLIVNPKVNIGNILEIVLQLLPVQEAEYLDMTNAVFLRKPKKIKQS